MSPTVLRQALANIPPINDENLLVGFNLADDAGVYRLSDDLALVQTVDFFTPIVDHPYDYGRIAAANSFSDVYAMGGTPVTCLNILCCPDEKKTPEMLAEILRGGQEKATEAGAAIVGGHTVTDPEMKYGMAVTGVIHPEKIFSNAGAQPGDVLILTKPVGTGIVTTGIKKRVVSDELTERVTQNMAALNKQASIAMRNCGAHACTDITGFALLGHATEMAVASGVTLRIEASKVPVYEELHHLIKKKCLTRGDVSNREYTEGKVRFARGIDKPLQSILFDPQTSGGLLVATPPDSVDAFMAECDIIDEGVPAIVGEVLPKGESFIDVL